MHASAAGTIFRFVCLAGATLAAMALCYRLLRRLGRSDQTSAGVSFILPWLIGFSLLTLGPMLLSGYLAGRLSSPGAQPASEPTRGSERQNAERYVLPTS